MKVTSLSVLGVILLLSQSAQAGSCILSGTELGNQFRNGTELGNGNYNNGGNGVLFKAKKTGVITVYSWDLVYKNILSTVDVNRIRNDKFIIDPNLLLLSQNAIKSAFLDSPKNNQVMGIECHQGPKGFCAKSTQKNTVKTQKYSDALSETLAYHLSQLKAVSPILAEAIAIRLTSLRFEWVLTDPDMGMDVSEDMTKALRSSMESLGGKPIGCARHNPVTDIVEWGEPCLTTKMPLSHAAAVLIHEALYALLIDQTKALASEPASSNITEVVSAIFDLNPPNKDSVARIVKFAGVVNACATKSISSKIKN